MVILKEGGSVITANNSIRKKSFFNRVYIFFYKYKFLHFLVLPGIVYYIIFHYLPMFGLVISFKDYTGMGGIRGIFESEWIGLRNFEYLFGGYYFWRLLRNTLLISLYRLIWGFPAPIILALLMNELRNQKFKRITQTITYIPHFVSWVVVSGLVVMFLSSDGPVNAFLGIFGIENQSFLTNNNVFRSILVTSGIWKETGWGTILYLAALSSIPMEQYESAYIEGATRWQRMRYITIPNIMFVVTTLLILRLGSIINENFDQIFNLYNEAVYDVADVFETYVFRRGIEQRSYSYATATGLFKSVANFILVMAANKGIKLLGREGIW